MWLVSQSSPCFKVWDRGGAFYVVSSGSRELSQHPCGSVALARAGRTRPQNLRDHETSGRSRRHAACGQSSPHILAIPAHLRRVVEQCSISLVIAVFEFQERWRGNGTSRRTENSRRTLGALGFGPYPKGLSWVGYKWNRVRVLANRWRTMAG